MILVTGATGLIGTYLVDQLIKDGIEVLAAGRNSLGEDYYTNNHIPFIKLDITQEKDFNNLPKKGIDAVVHLAALLPANVSQNNYNPKNYIDVNITGTVNVLEFCRLNKIPKIIYSSSHSDVESSWDLGLPIKESTPRSYKYNGDHTVYIISKLAGADLVYHYEAEYGLHGIVFRLPPVYGYGPHTEIFVDGKPLKTGFEIFIENAMAGKPIELWGDPEKGRDIIYVKDVVSAILSAINSEKSSGLYNVASGKFLSLKEQAEKTIEVFSTEEHISRIIYRPEKTNSIRPFIYDVSKAKKELGWSPKFNFEQMLLDYKKEMESHRFKFLIDKNEAVVSG